LELLLGEGDRNGLMNIIQITPGAGGMYCGGCLRDNALVKAWRSLGHQATMVPLYLPMTLDEEDQSDGAPIFFGGINVFLQQKSSFFGRLPGWLHGLLDSPRLLKLAAGSAAKTRPEEVGELTLSMLKGEEGRQTRELDELTGWLGKQPRPDVICLSNALLLGLAGPVTRALGVPVVCLLAGEDSFLDSLAEPFRGLSWQTVAEKARETSLVVAPSRYYRSRMAELLDLPFEKVRVVYNGISADDGSVPSAPPDPPVVGYFARMCREKGLPTLVEAFIELKRRDRIKGLKLRVGGSLSPADEKNLVDGLRAELAQLGLLADVEFCPNLTREAKQEFYRSLSVFSVPALYGEAFGLYLIEAWAAGIPVVQPRHGAFPELLEVTGGGLVCEPGNSVALADGIEELLLDPARALAMGQAGRQSVLNRFSINTIAAELVEVFQDAKRQGELRQWAG
jgi:glycosyltransferase involved in cell wall biosynthesis